jgi:hypothetical protein
MTSLFQVGTLFLIRRPFRLRGLLLFCLSLHFYSRFLAYVSLALGYPDLTHHLTVRFPILAQQSWFFTSHAIMTAITPLLHQGMINLSKSSYALSNLAILILLTVWTPDGPIAFDTFPGPGTNWMNASMLYFFAGYFALHGWPLNGILTWIVFAIVWTASFYLVKYDINQIVDNEWRWLVQSLQFSFRREKDTMKLKWTAGSSRCYVSPLGYIGGVVALYTAQTVRLPKWMGLAIGFLGSKIYVLHFLDSSIVFAWQRKWLFRIAERNGTEWSCFCGALGMSFELAMVGFVLEIYKDWIFKIVIMIGEWVWRMMKRLCEQIVWRREAHGKGEVSGRRYKTLIHGCLRCGCPDPRL